MAKVVFVYECARVGWFQKTFVRVMTNVILVYYLLIAFRVMYIVKNSLFKSFIHCIQPTPLAKHTAISLALQTTILISYVDNISHYKNQCLLSEFFLRQPRRPLMTNVGHRRPLVPTGIDGHQWWSPMGGPNVSYNSWNVKFENSVMRVAVRHHKACHVMPNSHSVLWNFQSALNNHFSFFINFLHKLHLILNQSMRRNTHADCSVGRKLVYCRVSMETYP